MRAIEAIPDLLVRQGRRPLMHHQLTCGCAGADESCLANFIGAAAEGVLEDAMPIAPVQVPAGIAPVLVNHAEMFGLGLGSKACSSVPVLPQAPVGYSSIR